MPGQVHIRIGCSVLVIVVFFLHEHPYPVPK
jgi:hypothetical protein